MKYLVVIPARGGSKGIPHKNIYKVAGKPLLQYAIDSMAGVKYEGDLVVSTDDKMIAEVACRNKSVVTIKRPDSIATDKAKTEEALIHALKYMKETYDKEYDAVITLQPTSPLRTSETIQQFISYFEMNLEKYDALLTLSENRSDFWIKRNNGIYERLFPDAPRRRQDREPLYVENSAIYVTTTRSLLETNSVLGHHVNGYVIDEQEAVDINEFIDIALAENLIMHRKGKRHEENNDR